MAVIYLCPADKRLSCSWEGSANEIKQHFENEHQQLLSHTNCVEIELEELPENRLLFLEEGLFLMQSHSDGSKLVVKLRYLGSNEAAAKIQYYIAICINKISYKYEPSRFFSCVVPTVEGWEINLESLEKFHGKFATIQCTVSFNYTIEIQGEDSTATTNIRKDSTTTTNIRKDSTTTTNIRKDSTTATNIRKDSTTTTNIRKDSTASTDTERKTSVVSLKINNQFVEANVWDETEQNILDDLKLVDHRLEQLKLNQRKSGDFMDKISQLDFSILEEPFNKHDESEQSETLPYIPEEVNLSCSSCNLDMLPPIYLCINGHNICSWCKSQPCQICHGTTTNNRNIDLENISRTHLHQCRYSSDGCNERLFYNEVRTHEAKCQFCKYKCMSDCPHQGKFDQFHNHLKIVHSSVKLGFETRNDFPKNHELYIVNKSVGIFYCKSESVGEELVWRATFCGPKERQFFCELGFKGSKYKEPIFLKRKGNVYEIRKSVAELKKNKAKEKYAVLIITSYDS